MDHDDVCLATHEVGREIGEETVLARGVPFVDDVVKDVCHGVRLLGRNNIFGLTAVASLAISA